MSDLVLVAIVTTLGGVIVAWMANISPKLKRIEASAKEAKEQTANDHIYRDANGNPILDRDGNSIPLNLRVDLDDKHEDVMNTLNLVARHSVAQSEMLATHTAQLSTVFEKLGIHEKSLEDTYTREEVRRVVQDANGSYAHR